MPMEGIHFFACGSGFKGAGLFALTKERSGENLPKADCPGGWAFEKSLDAVPSSIDGIAVDAKMATADLEKTGYHLMYIKGPDAGTPPL
jgi:hypothetical protein